MGWRSGDAIHRATHREQRPHFGAVAFSGVVFWQRRTGEPETKVGTHKEVTVREQCHGKWIVARQIAYSRAREPKVIGLQNR